MSFPHLIRFGLVLPSVALIAAVASAQHHGGGGHAGGHVGGHMGGVHMGGHPGSYGGYHHYGNTHFHSGYYGGLGLGYGYGLYGPLGYGLGYSPFGYSGLGYGGIGYGSLGYGYGYPSTYSGSSYFGSSLSPYYSYGSSIGVPTIPGTYTLPSQTVPSQPMNPPSNLTDPNPIPLPTPSGNSGQAQPGTITVITDEGATVSFDGVSDNQTGTRHSFTTKPIASGIETRISVKVNGAGGPATISIGLRAGEKATVDMRK